MPAQPQTLQEKQEAKAKDPTNVWKQKDQSAWEFITIPEFNALGEAHAVLSINEYEFQPGQTYKVPPSAAETLRERIRTYAKETVRVMQPTRDYASEQIVAWGRTGGSNAPVAVNPTLFEGAGVIGG